MSISPPVRRLSSASSSSTKSSKREEDLINAYEAEEERIINVLSRKLERLQEEKIELENVLEAESESHVNRLSRELSALRMAQQQQQASPETQGNGTSNVTNGDRSSPVSRASTADPLTPSSDIMLDAMRRENEQLRNRLVDTERDYIRISRLNEIYREELIDYRRRLGLPVDNLIGLSPSLEPYSQPTHRRSMSSSSPTSSSASIALPLPTHGALRPGPSPSVPIPRPPSQIHRPVNNTSESTTPISHSPSSSESPYFSPIASANPTSMLSKATTPPSSASIAMASMQPASAHAPLSYPSVPPPSLSSSFGSPNVHRELSASPIEAYASRSSVPRRGSFGRRPEYADDLRRSVSRSHSRRESVERGARIAETGQLVPRSRTNSIASETIFPVDETGEKREL